MGCRVFVALGLSLAFCLTPAAALAEEGEGGLGLKGEAEAKEKVGEAGGAEVSVRSTGDAVTVAKVMSRMAATGYGAGGAVTVIGVSWKDLCMSPCTFKLEPGMHEIMVYGDGVSGASQKFDFREGKHHLLVKPGSSALSLGGVWVTALGVTAGVLGATFLIIDADEYPWALPVTIGGAVGIGGGIAMIVAGSTSLAKDPAPPAASRGRRLATPTLSYSGRF
jgi:hypothetical protein